MAGPSHFPSDYWVEAICTYISHLLHEDIEAQSVDSAPTPPTISPNPADPARCTFCVPQGSSPAPTVGLSTLQSLPGNALSSALAQWAAGHQERFVSPALSQTCGPVPDTLCRCSPWQVRGRVQVGTEFPSLSE